MMGIMMGILMPGLCGAAQATHFTVSTLHWLRGADSRTKLKCGGALSPGAEAGLPRAEAHEMIARLRGGGGGLDEDEETFKTLMAMSGCSSNLRLRDGERGRGLFAGTDVATGDTLLTVPLDACLVEPRVISEEEQEQLLGRKLSEGTCCEMGSACRWCEWVAVSPLRLFMACSVGTSRLHVGRAVGAATPCPHRQAAELEWQIDRVLATVPEVAACSALSLPAHVPQP